MCGRGDSKMTERDNKCKLLDFPKLASPQYYNTVGMKISIYMGLANIRRERFACASLATNILVERGSMIP